jgi:hypothetical protein
MKTQNFRLIGFFLAVMSANYFLTGCATNPTVTQEFFNDMQEYDVEHNVPAPGTFATFRFHISKDVVLTRVERELNVNKNATVVRRSTERNIVNLKSSTTGRVQGNPTPEKLEIAFEVLKDGSMPTFTFVQKPENGTDLYYFEQDSDGYIRYGGEYYTVTYKKSRRSMGEPFLLYVETSKEKTRSRTMRGLR